MRHPLLKHLQEDPDAEDQQHCSKNEKWEQDDHSNQGQATGDEVSHYFHLVLSDSYNLRFT